LVFPHSLTSESVTSRTAVYGPVRTVVWQGSVGDRRPYADLVAKHLVIANQSPFRYTSSEKRHGEARCQRRCAIRSRDMIFGVAQMNIDGDAVLRLRFCAHAACRAAFTICVSCDRGQRYCSPDRRLEVRRRQRRLTVATSKASRAGRRIAFASSAIGIGSANPP